jgi:hypothetical protein
MWQRAPSGFYLDATSPERLSLLPEMHLSPLPAIVPKPNRGVEVSRPLTWPATSFPQMCGAGLPGLAEGVYTMLRSFPRSLGLLGSRRTDGLTDGCGSGRAAAQAGQPVRTDTQVRGSGQLPNLPIFWTLVSPCIRPSPIGAGDPVCAPRSVDPGGSDPGVLTCHHSDMEPGMKLCPILFCF